MLRLEQRAFRTLRQPSRRLIDPSLRITCRQCSRAFSNILSFCCPIAFQSAAAPSPSASHHKTRIDRFIHHTCGTVAPAAASLYRPTCSPLPHPPPPPSVHPYQEYSGKSYEELRVEDYLLGRTSCLAVGVLCPTLGPPAQQQQQQGTGEPKWQATVQTSDSGMDFSLIMSISAIFELVQLARGCRKLPWLLKDRCLWCEKLENISPKVAKCCQTFPVKRRFEYHFYGTHIMLSSYAEVYKTSCSPNV